MASVRLPSLWSAVCRSGEIYNPALRSAIAQQRIRAYHPTRRFAQEPIPQRYGTANEPPPPVTGKKPTNQPAKQPQSQETTPQPKVTEMLLDHGAEGVKTEDKPADDKPAKDSQATKKEPTTVDGRVSTISAPMTDPMLDSTTPAKSSEQAPGTYQRAGSNPLDSILDSVPDPKQPNQAPQPHAEEHHPDRTFDEHSPPVKAPHIEQPRYIHHFDTYGLVKRLKDSGWDEKQAITVMKAMRVILGDKSDLAKEALVSRSNLENEAYLFKAACAELRTEVTTRRKSEQEKLRTERTQLQHEVDILSQRLGQETTGLKDELKGLFDDRKMAVRNEQRDMESKVQQLNYRITVDLQADGKSDVEGLRWIMTRRVILTLGLVVLMIVGGLKLAANAFAANEEAAKAAQAAADKRASAVVTNTGTQTEGGAYESLG